MYTLWFLTWARRKIWLATETPKREKKEEKKKEPYLGTKIRKPSSSAVILWKSQENKDFFHIFSLLHFFLFSCQNCYHLDIMFLSYTIKITLCLLCIALSLWFFLMIIQFIRYNKASIWLMLLGKKKSMSV